MKISLFIPLLIFSIISSINLFSQNTCSYDFNRLGGVIYFYKDSNPRYTPKTPEFFIEKAMSFYPCLDDNSLSHKQKSMICNMIASHYSQVAKTDSIIKYAKMAVEYDPIWYCGMMQRANNLPSDIADEHIMHHVLASEKIKEEVIGDLGCDLSVKEKRGKSAEKSIVHNKEYAIALEFLATRDQSERSQYSVSSTQNKMDAENRISLDSLFSLHGFPSLDQVGSEGVQNAWLVLQHSTNCEWTKKWIVRFLDAHKEDQKMKSLLSYTMKRFFDPVDGYCRKKDESGIEEFIGMIKEKYSEDFAERFGYSEY